MRPKSTRRPIPLRSQWSRHSRPHSSHACASDWIRVNLACMLSLVFRSPPHRVCKESLPSPQGRPQDSTVHMRSRTVNGPSLASGCDAPLSSKLVSLCRHKTRNSQWSSSGRVVNSCDNRAKISLDLLAARLHIYGGSEGSGAALRETGRNERDTRQPESLSTKGEFESEQH